MPTTLVIVESPAKCKKIESYLGPGYKVVASFGHLRTLKDLASIDINNNFVPKFTLIDEPLKLKQIELIRKEISQCNDVILALDGDREGEGIGFHICELFGLSINNTKRIVFNEITESAIQSSIVYPKRLNMDLVYAQQTRQILDLLVGYIVSPFLWNCLSSNYDKGLSAGRCQTPALKLIYENYQEIKKCPGKYIYNTFGYFTNLNLLFELNNQFLDHHSAKEFLKKCVNWQFKYNISNPKKVIKKSPEPLTTSLLQQLSSNELSMSPKETMKYAQNLYEAGYITYMRTDSKKYSNEFLESVKKYIEETYGTNFISANIDLLNTLETRTQCEQIKKTKQKKAVPLPQEAHEAIRPVNLNISSDLLKLKKEIDAKTIKLYDLIWKRSLESWMASAKFNSITANILGPNNLEFKYKAEEEIFLGWLILSFKKDPNINHYTYLQNIKNDTIMKPSKLESKFNLVELKSHFSEARLIQLLEEKGIGRPSTFAYIIDKLLERKYVEKQNIHGQNIEGLDYILDDSQEIKELTNTRSYGNEKNRLVIQSIGILVIEFLIDKFNTFFDYDFTKKMEDDLDLISKGQKDWSLVCESYYKELTNITNGLKDFKKFNLSIDENTSLIIGKYGPVIKYQDNERTTFLPVKKDINIDELSLLDKIILDDVLDKESLPKGAIGKYKGKDLFIKKSKYGVYAQWGTQKKSLKDMDIPIEKMFYNDVLLFLEKDDIEKPVGFVREINNHFSIRVGKFGYYIMYKKQGMKKPEFLKLNDFKSDYLTCDKNLILNWIKLTYNKE
jgi:DNA topoisomerase-1